MNQRLILEYCKKNRALVKFVAWLAGRTNVTKPQFCDRRAFCIFTKLLFLVPNFLKYYLFQKHNVFIDLPRAKNNIF